MSLKAKNKRQLLKLTTCRRLGKAIRERRIGLDVSQRYVAEEAGVQGTYVSEIECGCRNITLNELFKIAAALNLSASKLMHLSASVNLDI